jgi:hypothetical protein
LFRAWYGAETAQRAVPTCFGVRVESKKFMPTPRGAAITRIALPDVA